MRANPKGQTSSTKMPIYTYTAKTLEGKERKGLLEAKDKHQLARTLRQQGLILIQAEPEEAEKKKRRFTFSVPFLDRVSLPEKMMFIRNLQVMVAAGLSLPRSLETLTLQVKSNKFRRALLDIKEQILKGKNFSDSLNKWPDIFSELFRNMIKVGEETGTLEDVLKILAQQIEKEYELKSKIKGAMIYPAIIICVMIGVGILMLITTVPQLSTTFEELNIELPMTTQIVIGLANFLITKWYLVLLIIIILMLLFLQGLRTKKGKRIIDTLILKMPIVSPIVKTTSSASTARTLSSLISAGVSLVRSLEITSGTLGNIFYRDAMNESVQKVKKGEKLSEALKPYQNIYSPLIIQMVAVGEETGETSAILEKLADFFEEEAGRSTKNLASVIEPVLMVIIGGVIGFFAVSMIQPMYSMLGAI